MIITTTIDPRIDNMVATFGASPNKFTMTQATEFVTNPVRSSAWVLQTPRCARRTGRDVTNPGECDISVIFPRVNSRVLIGGIGVPPTRGHSGSLQIFNKQKSTVSDKIGDTPKFGTSVDLKLANDGDYTSIFSKVICRELSHSSSADLYSRCRVDFASNAVGTEAPHFVDLGLLAVNESN